jgi:hypothetical protein
MPMSARPARRHVRSALSLVILGATAAATTLAPAGPALARKDTPVRQIAYQQWDSAADFASGTSSGTTVVGDQLQIGSPTGQFVYTDPFGAGSSATYDRATWTSPVVTTGFPYTELVSSWNAHTPIGTWVQLSVHGKADDGTTSKEYILGRWSEGDQTIHRTSVPAQGDTLATVAIDTLIARKKRSLSDWQLTVSLFRTAGSDATPTVSLVGAMASGLPDSKSVPVSPLGGAEGIDLAVPPYSQEIHRGEYPQYNGGGEAWCSPTSTAMVLGFWQQSDPSHGPDPSDYSDIPYPDPWVDYAAANTYDWNYDGTGNWPFNTAYASRYGLEGFVTRLRSLTEAEQFIKAGIPLVVSVSFKESELTGSGYGTDGHLMVIRGFTADGDVIVNDPASHLDPSDASVRTVYDRAEFENVWVPRSGGIVYVIHPGDVILPPNVSGADHNW